MIMWTATSGEAGQITLFDRSWHNRAVVEPVMGFCGQEEYEEYMRAAPLFEEMLHNEGIKLIKLYVVKDRERVYLAKFVKEEE